MTLIDEALEEEANRFPSSPSLGLLDSRIRLLQVLLHDGRVLEIQEVILRTLRVRSWQLGMRSRDPLRPWSMLTSWRERILLAFPTNLYILATLWGCLLWDSRKRLAPSKEFGAKKRAWG